MDNYFFNLVQPPLPYYSNPPIINNYYNVQPPYYSNPSYYSGLKSKKIFSGVAVKCFFRAQISYILLFSRIPVSERSKSTVWGRHLFQNFFRFGTFWYASTLRKKEFSATLVKHFFIFFIFLVDFGDAGFGEIKDHRFRATPFQEFFCHVSFRYICVYLT